MRKILFYIFAFIGLIFAVLMTVFLSIADKVYDVKSVDYDDEEWYY